MGVCYRPVVQHEIDNRLARRAKIREGVPPEVLAMLAENDDEIDAGYFMWIQDATPEKADVTCLQCLEYIHA